MAKVIAEQRGYFGMKIREIGDVFDVPDEIMDDEGRRPKWVRLARSAEPVAVEPEPVAAPKAKPGPKAKTVAAPVAAPFADAPEPIRVQNEVNAATGATQPDWVAPGDI